MRTGGLYSFTRRPPAELPSIAALAKSSNITAGKLPAFKRLAEASLRPGMTRVCSPRQSADHFAVLGTSRDGPGRRADELTKEAPLRCFTAGSLPLQRCGLRSGNLNKRGMMLRRSGNNENRLKCHRQRASAGDHCRSNLEHEAILQEKCCGGPKRLSYEKSCGLFGRRRCASTSRLRSGNTPVFVMLRIRVARLKDKKRAGVFSTPAAASAS